MVQRFGLYLALCGAVSYSASLLAQERTPAHIHIGHVMTSINGTPGNVGLLAALEEEAGVAAEHARLALEAGSDLEALQKHLRHVRHAVDPSTEPSGPGKGYGVRKAAQGVETHIQLATRSDGATENIKRHATHVATCARNVASWSGAILAASEQALKATSAEDAADAVRRISELTRQILEGVDANRDGQVSWQQGEGGIAQAKQHLALLAEGEGLAKPNTSLEAQRSGGIEPAGSASGRERREQGHQDQ